MEKNFHSRRDVFNFKRTKISLSQADVINENKEEYLKAINEVEKEIERTQAER